VHGNFMVEVFARECIVTLGLMMARVPAVRPWDKRFGQQYDVLANGMILLALVAWEVIVGSHLGTPCQSSTFARFPQLRAWPLPLGLPGLLVHQSARVQSGNELAVVHQDGLGALREGGYFSLENPELCWLWVLDFVKEMYMQKGVIMARFKFRDFGTPWLKTACILTTHQACTIWHACQSWRSQRTRR
jgi:hypothetical protein